MEDERVKGLGQHDGLAAEPEPHMLLAGVSMVEGQAAAASRADEDQAVISRLCETLQIASLAPMGEEHCR